MLRSHEWQQSGVMALWQYTENEHNYPGWHMTADAAGCASLTALVAALLADGVPASRAVKVAKPTAAILAVPNNRGGRASIQVPDKLRIAASGTTTEWTFPLTHEPAQLTIGLDWLGPIRDGINGIPRGEGDYSIGGDKNGNAPLWFWWQPRGA